MEQVENVVAGGFASWKKKEERKKEREKERKRTVDSSTGDSANLEKPLGILVINF